MVAAIMWVGLPAALADQVTLQGVVHSGVRITGMESGLLVFREAGGEVVSAWLDEVDSINVDRGGMYVDLNDAERYFGRGELDNAMIRYRRAMRLGEDFWPEWIEARMVRVHERTGKIDLASAGLLRLLKSKRMGAGASSRLVPEITEVGDPPALAAAIRLVDAALGEEATDDQRFVMRLLRYSLASRGQDQRSSEISQLVAKDEVPRSCRWSKTYRLQLSAIKEWGAQSPTSPPYSALDVLIRDCPVDILPAALFLKGEWLLTNAGTNEEAVRASWPFLRIVIHIPESPLAPAALVGAGRAMIKMQRFDSARELLKEGVAHPRASEEVRSTAKELLHALPQVERKRR